MTAVWELINATPPDRIRLILDSVAHSKEAADGAYQAIEAARPLKASLAEAYAYHGGSGAYAAVIELAEVLRLEELARLEAEDAAINAPGLNEADEPLIAWLNHAPLEELAKAFHAATEGRGNAARRALVLVQTSRPLPSVRLMRETRNVGRRTMEVIELAAIRAGVIRESDRALRWCPHCGLGRSARKSRYRARRAEIAIRAFTPDMSESARASLEDGLCALARAALLTPHGAALAPHTSPDDLRALCLQAIDALDQQYVLEGRRAPPGVREIVVSLEVVRDGSRQLVHRVHAPLEADEHAAETSAVSALVQAVERRRSFEARAAEAVAAEFGEARS